MTQDPPAPASASSSAPAASISKPIKEKTKKKSSNVAKEDPNAPGVPVTLMYSDRSFGVKELVHTKQLKFTEKHAKLDGHAVADSTTDDSSKKARQFLQWFLAPISVEDFYENYWEKRTFVLKRGAAGILRPGYDAPAQLKQTSKVAAEQSNEHAYYGGWFSSKIIDQLLRAGELKYSTDIDVTLYKNGKRLTLNPNGNDLIDADLVWDLYEKQRCSVRVLRPHQYCQRVSTMLAHLEEEFGQGFGANTYLTPAGSQGFSPHWDDVEAFVVQLEGRKQWRIHAAREATDILPRESSKNFTQEEVGEPIMTVWLEPGDLLYFPRGTIHQAVSASDTHSLHLTVSTGHQNTWADLFDRVVPAALQQAAADLPELRESLPPKYGNYMGVMHSDLTSHEERNSFLKKATGFLDKIFSEFALGQLDDAADQMMAKFLWDRQPPQSMLNHKELGVSKTEMEGISIGPQSEPREPEAASSASDDDMNVGGGSENDQGDEGIIEDSHGDDEITLDTRVRLVTRDCIRLAVEGEFCGLYYATTNEPNYHEVEPQKLKLPVDYAESVELLWRSYPQYVACRDFVLEEDEEKVDLCRELVDRQIVMLE